jgi:hypothetical protein
VLWTDGGIFESVILVILVGIHCRSSGSHIRCHLVVIIRFLGVTWRRRRRGRKPSSTSGRPLIYRAAFSVRVPVFRESRAGR